MCIDANIIRGKDTFFFVLPKKKDVFVIKSRDLFCIVFELYYLCKQT